MDTETFLQELFTDVSLKTHEMAKLAVVCMRDHITEFGSTLPSGRAFNLTYAIKGPAKYSLDGTLSINCDPYELDVDQLRQLSDEIRSLHTGIRLRLLGGLE